MFDFQQKRKIRSVFGSPITQGVILLITLFILLSAYNRYLIARDMAERRFAVEAEIQALEERRQKLDQEVKYLSNERGVEAEMRRQFDITREGEQLVILLDDTEESSTSTNTESAATTTKAWYRFW
jgi:cell division protein FtsB